MIKKLVIIVVTVLAFSSCDRLLSFAISPGFYIPAFKAGWTVDNANSRIVGDPEYFTNHSDDFSDSQWTLIWNSSTSTLLFTTNSREVGLDYDTGDSEYTVPIGTEMPMEINLYNEIDSPFFYMELLFGYFQNDYDEHGNPISGTARNMLDIIAGGTIPLQQAELGRNNGITPETNYGIAVDYSMIVTASQKEFYILPEPAYWGIDEDSITTELAGNLNVLKFDITGEDTLDDGYYLTTPDSVRKAAKEFISGQAVCVFASAINPGDSAGLLYMVYYHGNGLISLLYANKVTTTETDNYFPDGHFEYIWSVYRNE